jgi:hypothetical protein
MPSEIRVNPPARSVASEAASTLSGLASVVTSASGASPNKDRAASSTPTRSAAGSRVGVPPPTNTVDSGGTPPGAAASTGAANRSSAITVCA